MYRPFWDTLYIYRKEKNKRSIMKNLTSKETAKCKNTTESRTEGIIYNSKTLANVKITLIPSNLFCFYS